MYNFITFLKVGDLYITDLNSSKHIKSLGFNLKTNHYWLDKDLPFVKKGLKYSEKLINHNRYDSFIYSAPTQEVILKWLKNKI